MAAFAIEEEMMSLSPHL